MSESLQLPPSHGSVGLTHGVPDEEEDEGEDEEELLEEELVKESRELLPEPRLLAELARLDDDLLHPHG